MNIFTGTTTLHVIPLHARGVYIMLGMRITCMYTEVLSGLQGQTTKRSPCVKLLMQSTI